MPFIARNLNEWRTLLARVVILAIRSDTPLADITVISHFPPVCPWLHSESHAQVALHYCHMVASHARDSTNVGQLDLFYGHWCFPEQHTFPYTCTVLLFAWNHCWDCVPGGRRGGEGASPQSNLVDVVVAGTAVQVGEWEVRPWRCGYRSWGRRKIKERGREKKRHGEREICKNELRWHVYSRYSQKI